MSEWPRLHLNEPEGAGDASRGDVEATAPKSPWPPTPVGPDPAASTGSGPPASSGSTPGADVDPARATESAAEPEAPESTLDPEVAPEPAEAAAPPEPERREPDPDLAAELGDLLAPATDKRSPGTASRLGPLLNSPDLLQRVVQQLGSDASEQDATAVVALEPDGSLVAVPMGLELGLPVFILADDRDEPGSADAAGAAGDGWSESWQGDEISGTLRLATTPGEGEVVYLVTGVLKSAERWGAAVQLIERSGATVAGGGTVVAGSESVATAEDISNLLSLTVL